MNDLQWPMDANGAPEAPEGGVWPSGGTQEWDGDERHCRWDNEPLPKKNRTFCSRACSNRWHDLNRPRIASAAVGHPREGSIRELVLGALQDGQWWSAHDLAAIAKADTHSVKARISKLIATGHRIVTDLPNGNSQRFHRYRLEVA